MVKFTPSFILHFDHCGEIGSSLEELVRGLEGFDSLNGDLVVRFAPKQDIVLYEADDLESWLRSLGYEPYAKTPRTSVLSAAAKIIWERACRLPPALAQREAWEIARAVPARKSSKAKSRAVRI